MKKSPTPIQIDIIYYFLKFFDSAHTTFSFNLCMFILRSSNFCFHVCLFKREREGSRRTNKRLNYKQITKFN